MAKLGMHLVVEFPASGLFDRDVVRVRNSLIVAQRLPRSRILAWHDPQETRGLRVSIGEVHPRMRVGEFCGG